MALHTQEVASGSPAEVEVVPVAQRDVPVYGEWIGTLEGMVNATIKAQVTGYLPPAALHGRGLGHAGPGVVCD